MWQSSAGAAEPVGEARPAWKMLRVLGNLLHLPGFDYQSSDEVLAECAAQVRGMRCAPYRGSHSVAPARMRATREAAALPDVPMYQIDAVVRRAPSLQRTREGRSAPRGLLRGGRGDRAAHNHLARAARLRALDRADR